MVKVLNASILARSWPPNRGHHSHWVDFPMIYNCSARADGGDALWLAGSPFMTDPIPQSSSPAPNIRLNAVVNIMDGAFFRSALVVKGDLKSG